MKEILTEWRKFLKETINPTNPDWALWTDVQGTTSFEDGVMFVLYDRGELYDALRNFEGELDSEYRSVNQSIISEYISEQTDALIAMTIVEDGRDYQGPCFGSWQIKRTAVSPQYQRQNLGKWIYEIAIAAATSQGSPATSDKGGGTSKKAGRVWTSIEKDKERYEFTPPFDDIKDPKTPPPEDDCKISPSGRGANYGVKLSDAAMGERTGQMQELINRHNELEEEYMEVLSEIFNDEFTIEDLERTFTSCGNSLFANVYGE